MGCGAETGGRTWSGTSGPAASSPGAGSQLGRAAADIQAGSPPGSLSAGSGRLRFPRGGRGGRNQAGNDSGGTGSGTCRVVVRNSTGLAVDAGQRCFAVRALLRMACLSAPGASGGVVSATGGVVQALAVEAMPDLCGVLSLFLHGDPEVEQRLGVVDFGGSALKLHVDERDPDAGVRRSAVQLILLGSKPSALSSSRIYLTGISRGIPRFTTQSGCSDRRLMTLYSTSTSIWRAVMSLLRSCSPRLWGSRGGTWGTEIRPVLAIKRRRSGQPIQVLWCGPYKPCPSRRGWLRRRSRCCACI